MADNQKVVGGVEAAPKDWLIPENASILLKAINAEFTDNGASGDWLPCVTLISDSGHVIARAADQGVKVTAGDDAEVSWFPGLKGAAAAAGVTGVASGIYQGASSGGSQILASGAATTLTWDATVSAPGSFPLISNSPFGVTTFSVTAWRVHVDFTVVFPAGNYDRYIEVNQTPGVGNVELHTPIRNRAQITPDGDTLSVSCVVGGNPGTPSNLNLVAYQGSGVNKTVVGYCWLVGWSIPLPSKVWS